MRAATFIDRDGVLNALVPDALSGFPESPLDPEDVRLLPGAGAAVRLLQEVGYVVIGVSNQPAAAKGVVGLERLESVHARVIDLLKREGATLDGFRLCYHHPHGVNPELAFECLCRKPLPGMLLEAAKSFELDLAASWMIGDTDSDVAAGAAAGCRTALIHHPASAHKRSGRGRSDVTAPDLTTATELIVRASIPDNVAAC